MNTQSLVQAGVVALMSVAFPSTSAQTTTPSTTKASSPQTGKAMKSGGANESTSGTSGSKSKSAGGTDATTVLVLMPVAMTVDNKLGNGCWVQFFDNKNYRGTTLTLVGPTDMPRMDVPGAAWREWDSAIVGPKARVTTYDNENYNDRTATLTAGQRVADLSDAKLGWFEEVHSAKVSCAS